MVLLVALVVTQPGEQWTREDLEEVRRLLTVEYVGSDRADALAAVEVLLDRVALGQPVGRDTLVDLGIIEVDG